MRIEMKTQPAPTREKGELSSVLYRIQAQERVIRERVIRASLRPKPRWMPERVYQYLTRRLFVVTDEEVR